MARKTRAQLQLESEAGDPVASTWATNVYDSFFSLLENNLFTNGITLSSETAAKLKIIFQETLFEVTTDGGAYGKGWIYIDDLFAQLGVGDDWIEARANNLIFYVDGAGRGQFAKLAKTGGGFNYPFILVLNTYVSNAVAVADGLTVGCLYTDGIGNVKVVF